MIIKNILNKVYTHPQLLSLTKRGENSNSSYSQKLQLFDNERLSEFMIKIQEFYVIFPERNS